MYKECKYISLDFQTEKFGNYNDFPPNMELISEVDSTSKVFQVLSEPTIIQYRQFRKILDNTVMPNLSCEAKIHDGILYFDETQRAGILIGRSRTQDSQNLYFFKFKWKYQLPCEMVEDTNWEINTYTSRLRRGITDYDRYITFERGLTGEEIIDLQYWLQTENCPGWTGIMINLVSDNPHTYKCSTTWDSSD